MNTNIKQLEQKTEEENSHQRNLRTAATENLYIQLDDLKERIAAVERPFDAQIKANDDALHQARVDAYKVEIKKLQEAVAMLPSQEVFNSTLNQAEVVYGKGFKNIYSYGEGLQALRAPKVDGFTVLAAFYRNKKLYAAWSTKSGERVGVMYVEGAKHPGDATEAFAIVGGKEVKFPDGSNYGVARPVDTFLSALKAL